MIGWKKRVLLQRVGKYEKYKWVGILQVCKQNAGLYTQGPDIRMMSHRAMSTGSSSSFIAALGEGAFRNVNTELGNKVARV